MSMIIQRHQRIQEKLGVITTCPNWKIPGAAAGWGTAAKLKLGPVLLAACPKSNPVLDFFSDGCPKANPELELLTLLPNAGAGPPKAEGAVAAGAGGLLLPNWKDGVVLEDGAGAPNAGVLEGGAPNPEPLPNLFSLLPNVKSEGGALTPLLIVGAKVGEEKESFLAGSLVSDESTLELKENAGAGLFSSLLAEGWDEENEKANVFGVDALSPNANILPEEVVLAPLVAPKGTVNAAVEVAVGIAVVALAGRESLLAKTPKGDATATLFVSSSLFDVVTLLKVKAGLLVFASIPPCFPSNKASFLLKPLVSSDIPGLASSLEDAFAFSSLAFSWFPVSKLKATCVLVAEPN